MNGNDAAASVPAEDAELLATAAEHAGAHLRSATLRSVHERPGRSTSMVYEAVLDVDGAQREVLLVAHSDRRGLPDGSFALTRGGVTRAVWRFPHDPYLPGLPSAVDAVRVRELLDTLDGPDGEVRLHTRAYRPSRRAVVEVSITDGDGAGRILYLKVFAGDRAAETAEIHRRLREHVPVPRVVGTARDQGILALEALEGRTLRSALVDGAPLPAAAEIVALSESFAATELRTRRDPRAFADPSRHVDGLLTLAPELRSAIQDVANAAVDLDAERVAVHGDLHDGQLLLIDGSISGLLDVDGSGRGFVAHDAGNLIAHTQVVGELWPDASRRCEAYASEIADAYRPLVGADALARATAAAWLGLATGPYRAQEADWPEATRRRIGRALAAVSDLV